MLAKMLGVGDLLASVVVVLAHLDIFVGWKLLLIFSLYLAIKGFIFRGSIISILDILCGLYLFVMMFGLTTFVSWIIAAYLFQKACFSLAAD